MIRMLPAAVVVAVGVSTARRMSGSRDRAEGRDGARRTRPRGMAARAGGGGRKWAGIEEAALRRPRAGGRRGGRARGGLGESLAPCQALRRRDASWVEAQLEFGSRWYQCRAWCIAMCIWAPTVYVLLLPNWSIVILIYIYILFDVIFQIILIIIFWTDLISFIISY